MENITTSEESGIVAKKGKGVDTGAKKVRLVLTEPEDSPLNLFQGQLKERGLKNYDLAAIVSEALQEVSEEWWQEKLDELTPIEFRLQAALENPEMREKIMSVLKNSPVS